MISRQESRQRQLARKHALQRYQQQRARNVLAQPGVYDFVMVLDNLKAGFNVPKIFRSAEAMGACAVHLINIGPFDPAPAKGSFKKVPAHFHDTFDECYQALSEQGYHFYTLEPKSSTTIFNVMLPRKSAFIMGNEEFGIQFDRNAYPDIESISIPQFGNVESLNVSIAASIMMFEYVRQHYEI
jgi:tRNA G18 (ribose-2'-O)-methylase SpoU